LPESPDLPPADNLLCYAVGWGNTEDKLEYKRPRALKQLRVNVIPHDKCNSNVSYNGSVPETYFCAGFSEGMNDTCYGDSGGPLQCDNGDDTWTVRGLVSWGIGCARPNKFGVYSNVSKYMPFLNKVMSGDYDNCIILIVILYLLMLCNTMSPTVCTVIAASSCFIYCRFISDS
jgi:hypothetical protein